MYPEWHENFGNYVKEHPQKINFDILIYIPFIYLIPQGMMGPYSTKKGYIF